MDTIRVIVQFGLLILAVVSGAIGITLLLVSRLRPERKKKACWACKFWEPLEMGYGRCVFADKICRAEKRACEHERRGK